MLKCTFHSNAGWLITAAWSTLQEETLRLLAGLREEGTAWSECWPCEWGGWTAMAVFSIYHPRAHRIKCKLASMAYKMCTPYCIPQVCSGIVHKGDKVLPVSILRHTISHLRASIHTTPFSWNNLPLILTPISWRKSPYLSSLNSKDFWCH